MDVARAATVAEVMLAAALAGLVAACAAPAPPDGEVVFVVGAVQGRAHHEGLSHAPTSDPPVVTTSLTFEGRRVRVGERDRFDIVDVAPGDTPGWAVVGVHTSSDGGLFVVDLTSGATHHLDADVYAWRGGGWMDDGVVFVTNHGLWSTADSSLVPYAVDGGDRVVKVSPDRSAVVELHGGHTWGPDDAIVPNYELRVRSTSDRRVLQTVPLPVEKPWLVDPPPGCPWPGTSASAALWVGRQIDLVPGPSWTITLAAEPRGWPAPAAGTVDHLEPQR